MSAGEKSTSYYDQSYVESTTVLSDGRKKFVPNKRGTWVVEPRPTSYILAATMWLRRT